MRAAVIAATVGLGAGLLAAPGFAGYGGSGGAGAGGPSYTPGSGGYAGGDTTESRRGNPCLDAVRRRQLRLLCPDLRMAPPSDLYIDPFVRPGKRMLRATNNIMSRGHGPAEISGFRISRYSMRFNQRIHQAGGGEVTIRTTGRLDFYPVPGQGRYWKLRDAARFELWRAGGNGRPFQRVAVGPKQVYCLRDLTLTAPNFPRAPQSRQYPGCSQDRSRRHVTLGTSVGWSDIYPATYNQNWINVTGLRGCFFFFHIADPRNHIRELDEDNNRSHIRVRLPNLRVADS